MKNFLIFLSVTVVFCLAINDFIDRFRELDNISKNQKINNELIINHNIQKAKK